ncbi:MAG: hypothetical protein KF749_09230 [Bacteroidetes bacterium]|nr:hypothetical protein [Bacteroidota bacterium]MCW5894807.1 hypothetical protein [Bacteroidota bacterium]
MLLKFIWVDDMRLTRFCLMLLTFAFCCPENSPGQDTTMPPPMVKGGIYDRPYLFRPSSRIAIGGYAETMVRSEWVEGIHENVSFEARRFNIFLYSAIAPFVKLTSELEFEHGTEEIKLEVALIDIEFHEALNLRGGILLSPLGKFNLAHDSPGNPFTDRPLVSTAIIPSTFSEAGLGLFGSVYPSAEHRLTYEAYLVNGLNDDVLLGGEGTSIPAGRPSAFDEDNNGSPAFVGRVAWLPEFGLELGVSLHSGLYNTFKEEGLIVDDKRGLTIAAIDLHWQIGDLEIAGEYARARIDIPASLNGMFAARQQGYYGQALYNVLSGIIPQFPNSVLAVGARYDYVDLDAELRGDDTHRLSVGVNLRLVPDTVIKLDYQHNWMFDRINNMERSAVIQFGVATYF